MEEYVSAFIEYLTQTKNYSAHTATAYETDIRDFIKFYEELLKQPEEEAKNLALVIERYVLRWYGYFCKENKYRN